MARHRDTTEDTQHKAEALQEAEDQRQEAEDQRREEVLLKAQVETPDPSDDVATLKAKIEYLRSLLKFHAGVTVD